MIAAGGGRRQAQINSAITSKLIISRRSLLTMPCRLSLETIRPFPLPLFPPAPLPHLKPTKRPVWLCWPQVDLCALRRSKKSKKGQSISYMCCDPGTHTDWQMRMSKRFFNVNSGRIRTRTVVTSNQGMQTSSPITISESQRVLRLPHLVARSCPNLANRRERATNSEACGQGADSPRFRRQCRRFCGTFCNGNRHRSSL